MNKEIKSKTCNAKEEFGEPLRHYICNLENKELIDPSKH